MTDASDFPLGVPVNRPETPKATPIEGRPNWFRDKDGHEFYVEPNQPPAGGTASTEGTSS